MPADQLRTVVEEDLLPRFVRILTATPLTLEQVAEREELAELGITLPGIGQPTSGATLPPWAGLVDPALAAGLAAADTEWLQEHIVRLRTAIEKQLQRHF